VDPTGKFAFVAAYEELDPVGSPALISEYSIATDGSLALMLNFPMQDPPAAMVMSPRGFLYYINDGATPGPILIFSINPNSGSTDIVGSTSTGNTIPLWISFDPIGSYAYLSNTDTSNLSQFKVDPTTGVLSTNGPDLPMGSELTASAVDPSGQFLFVANNPTNAAPSQLTGFLIGSDGTLSLVGSTPLRNDAYPAAIVFAQQ